MNNDDQNNYNQNDYDQNAAQDAGRFVGQAEGDYDRANQDINRDEQRIEDFPQNMGRDAEQDFNNAEQDVRDVPSDIGGAFRDAAGWIGDKVGGVQRDYNDGEQRVDNFGDSMNNSYEQGEQQGEGRGGY